MIQQALSKRSEGRLPVNMPWNEIMEVERESYPEDMQASLEQLKSRYEVFPEGFFLAHRDGNLAGFATCQLVIYKRGLLGQSWDEWTDNGWIKRSHNPTGDALFGISMCTRPSFRGRGVSKELMDGFKRLAVEKGLECIFFGSRLSSLETFLRYGFTVIKAVPNYGEDKESHNWATVVKWINPKAT